jgi:hypothetical protein
MRFPANFPRRCRLPNSPILRFCTTPRPGKRGHSRAQAAALGIARSSYWSHLDALVNLTHSKPISIAGASVPIQTRYGPSVSLAYTLFDFGSRAGAVEAARYRLLAANLLQNRALQDVVLPASRRSRGSPNRWSAF